MARITAKQAKEMNEAYAKVHQNLQERESILSNIPSQSSQTRRRNMAGKEDLNTKTLKTPTTTEKPAAQNNNQTTEKPVAQKNERPVSSAKQRWLDSQQSQKNLKDATKGYKFSRTDDGNIRADKVSGNNNQSSNNNQQSTQSNNNQQSTQSNNNNQQSNNNQSSGDSTRKGGGTYKFKPGEAKALGDKLKADSGDRVQSSGNTPSPKQPTQEPGVKTSQTVVKDGNKTTTTTRRSADDSTPEGAAAVAKEKAAFKARREANTGSGNPGSGGQPPSTQGGDQQKTVRGQGNRERPVKTGGIQVGKSIKGGLSRLGSLAGKAVAGARNVASNVKQGAQAVAGGIKQGAQAVAGALQNKGPIRGRSGANAAMKAKRLPGATGGSGGTAPAPADKPVATRPVQGQQPAAKPVVTQQQPAKRMGQTEIANRARFGNDKVDALKSKNAEFQAAKKSGNLAQYRKANPKMSGADRAKAMAKARIAAKNAPAQKAPTPTPVNASYDFFDDTVQFLVSEGHAKDVSEAMSIMSESEFIDAFNQELNG